MSSTILPADLSALDALRFLVGAGPGGVGPVKGTPESEDDGVDDDSDDSIDDPDDGADGEEDGDDDKPLGPKGEKALAALKEKSKQERARRIAAEAELRRLRAGKSPEPSGDTEDDEKTRIIEERITSRANRRIISAEVRAAAATKLADPSDAHKFLDLDQFEVGEDGEVDQDEIADAIDDLLKDKPYLAAQGGTRKTPRPDRRQGGGQRESTGTVASGRAAYLARKNKTN
ncbi:hypothetical protein A6411_10725 [Prescottella equi]|uniref:hypothetical protein n=1 Tax=Rhodococcus hoagii TaxID=43767 RepID=UPI0009EF8958|nr:hypothetical protein [Prescottella equi]OQQ32272.1 hypothetical protein A6411_10725 [Prescottella equi]